MSSDHKISRLADQLRIIRNDRGLTQQETADLAKVTTWDVKRIELGSNVDLKTIVAVFAGLGYELTLDTVPIDTSSLGGESWELPF